MRLFQNQDLIEVLGKNLINNQEPHQEPHQKSRTSSRTSSKIKNLIKNLIKNQDLGQDLIEILSEKKPHWESQWESQWGLAQDLDFWWFSWWGSWFVMRFLMRFLILNEVLTQDLIEILNNLTEILMRKKKFFVRDRRARETQKEKEAWAACLEKNRIRSASRRLDQNALKRSATNIPRINQACHYGPLLAGGSLTSASVLLIRYL